MEEAVGMNNFLGGASRISNWIHISLDSVPWLPSHPYVSLEFIPKVCTAGKREGSRGEGTWEDVRLPPLPLLSPTTSTAMPQRLLEPQVFFLG